MSDTLDPPRPPHPMRALAQLAIAVHGTVRIAECLGLHCDTVFAWGKKPPSREHCELLAQLALDCGLPPQDIDELATLYKFARSDTTGGLRPTRRRRRRAPAAESR